MSVFSFRESGGSASGENRETSETARETRPQETVHREREHGGSAEAAENAFSETLEDVRSRYGASIPESQRARMEAGRENAAPRVMSVREYHEQFPGADISVLGHCDSEGRIYLKEGDDGGIRHVTTHETMHFGSYREVYADPSGETVYRSGLRETRVNGGETVADQGRGLNEGLTELYTLRTLEARGDTEAAQSFRAYPEARGYAAALEDAVGSETLERAYFGGELTPLKQEVCRLNYGDEQAWREFSEDVDTVEYSGDAAETRAARARLAFREALMASFREQEAANGRGIGEETRV